MIRCVVGDKVDLDSGGSHELAEKVDERLCVEHSDEKRMCCYMARYLLRV